MSEAWEELAMQIILHGGNARALAYEALTLAKKEETELAEETLAKAETELQEAHQFQTQALQNGAIQLNANTPLILVHAQDHLMTAMAEKNLIAEMIEIYKKLKTSSGKSL